MDRHASEFCFGVTLDREKDRAREVLDPGKGEDFSPGTDMASTILAGRKANGDKIRGALFSGEDGEWLKQMVMCPSNSEPPQHMDASSVNANGSRTFFCGSSVAPPLAQSNAAVAVGKKGVPRSEVAADRDTLDVVKRSPERREHAMPAHPRHPHALRLYGERAPEWKLIDWS